MPTIYEDEASEFSQPGQQSTWFSTSEDANLTALDAFPATCAPSDLDISYATHDINFSLPPSDAAVEAAVEAPFSDFASWIPRYTKIDTPCDYCRSRHLVCFKIIGCGQNAPCNACTSLFRSCSFAEDPSTRKRGPGRLDTLQPLPEDLAQESGGLTGTKSLISTGATYDDIVRDLQERGPEKNFKRFSRVNVHILKNWINTHADHPYPTEEEKEDLKQKTGLTISQVSNWLANARRRGKVRTKSSSSPSSVGEATSQAMDIPKRPANIEDLTPFERWKISPPENEPARINDIARAIETTDLEQSIASSGHTSRTHSISEYHHRRTDSTPGSALSTQQEPSISSFDTGHSSGSYGASSAFSHPSSRGSYGAFARKEQRRRKKTTRKSSMLGVSTSKANQHRPFQCTFCTDTFASKYDWTRHEKSLHLSLERWICAPLGPVITSADGTSQCVFCELPNPSKEHLESHNHEDCQEKGLAARTFYRKDHLRQHLRLVHDIPQLINSMDTWKATPDTIRSRCGFCSARFTTWAERAEHLAKHFREGAKIGDWKGDWGFDPEVGDSVTNAMPPFLIANESQSVLPFSASNIQTYKDIELQDGRSSRATCWQILTLRLGKYARESQMRGERPTDCMLQARAREILYGSAEDEWNQTAADNPEWLGFFKQAHGLGNGTESAGASVTAPPTDQASAAACLQQMNDDLWLFRGNEYSVNCVNARGYPPHMSDPVFGTSTSATMPQQQTLPVTDGDMMNLDDLGRLVDYNTTVPQLPEDWNAPLMNGTMENDDGMEFESFNDILFPN
ncbi:hypothetical protein FH972_023523 [Carpinus fangiana]|uniref:Homeobox domain-containing protein n=1 Tax=Carpinus fangiana TaxID=176857 RepID=A0A5N6KVN9_9ROSI|nr:hypothetical protein FH972_023523 [Carpinus fangiana]